MAALSLIPWLALAVIRPSWRPASRMAPAFALSVAIFAISTATSRQPRLSIEMFAFAFLLVEIYLLLVTLMRRPALRLHFQRLALVLCVVVCIAYLVEVLQAWLTWWGLVGHLAIPPLRPGYIGLFMGPNPIASIVLLFGAFGLAAAGTGGQASRVGAIAIAILVLGTTFITGSRGAWLGTAIGALAVLVAWLLAAADHRVRVRALARTRAAVVALVAGVPLVVGGGLLVVLSGRLNLDDLDYRAGFARASIQMFQSSPLTGVGPGTWGMLRASYTIPTDPDLYIPHAHSIYFQTLAEFGLLGVIGAAAVVAGLGLLMARAIRSPDAARRRVAYATLFGVVVMAGQQFADMLMNVPAVLLALALPIAWLDAASFGPMHDRPVGATERWAKWRGAVPLGTAILTLAIIVGLVRIEAAAGVATRAVEAANTGDWPAAATLAGEAVADDPDVNVYRFELGIGLANAGRYQLAQQELETSAAVDDYRYAWLDLAAVRWRLADPSGARDALARAERLGLQRTPLAVAAGWLHQQLGDEQLAIADYAIAIGQVPTLANDPFWDSTSGPPGGLGPILDLVQRRMGPFTMLQVHLVLRQFGLAQRDVAILRPSDPDIYSRLIPAWQGDAPAWVALQAVAASRPRDPGPASWCRLVASYLGDEALAQNFESRISIANFPDDGAPAVAHLVFDSAQSLPSSIVDGYGTLYRRLVPTAQVVGFLPQLILGDRP